MATRVFISYRRDDSAGSAGRVPDRLERELGRDLLFMDVDAIPLGLNFVKVLRDEVAKCDVLLAVIGPHWVDASDEHGNRRLDDPNDFLRVEIVTALQRNIPVIPILVDGAKVPKADRLPKDLEELARRNGLDVRHASFHSDIDKLIRALKGQSSQYEATTAPQSQPKERQRSIQAERNTTRLTIVVQEIRDAEVGLIAGLTAAVPFVDRIAGGGFPPTGRAAIVGIPVAFTALIAIALYNWKRLSGWIIYGVPACAVYLLTAWVAAIVPVLHLSLSLGFLITAGRLSCFGSFASNVQGHSVDGLAAASTS